MPCFNERKNTAPPISDDIASPDHAACIARIKSLNPWHLGKIIAKGRTLTTPPHAK